MFNTKLMLSLPNTILAAFAVSPVQIGVESDYLLLIGKMWQNNPYQIILFAMIICTLFTIMLYLLHHKNQQQLKKIAYTDSLTGISTLTKFQLDVSDALSLARPSEYMLVSMDIDNFKYINDSFGYEIGNKVLEQSTKHFILHMKPNEFIGRISADNFVFLIKKLEYDKLIEAFSTMIDVEKRIEAVFWEHYNICFSAGVYIITDTKTNFSIALDRANIARKSAKGTHTSNIVMYTEEMDRQQAWKKEVTLSMERALINEEFIVYLQPKYSFRSKSIIGAEALVRWSHPVKGLLSPFWFIDIFEQNGFIKKLDLYVFEQVCKLFARWKQEDFSVAPKSISVNLSRLHLTSPHLVECLLEIINKYNIEPHLVEIELTESTVFHNTSTLIHILNKLKTSGFTLSIDDFGSGYSSLNMLKDLPVDVLKIDKGFLGESSLSGNGRVIIAKVIEMAQSLKLVTVAEGVETKEQVDMLIGMDCDIAQGYYYAKPMPIPEFELFVQNFNN